jgi:hypothetical protein
MKRMNGRPMSETTQTQPFVPNITEMRGACDRFLFDRPRDVIDQPQRKIVRVRRSELSRFGKQNP